MQGFDILGVAYCCGVLSGADPGSGLGAGSGLRAYLEGLCLPSAFFFSVKYEDPGLVAVMAAKRGYDKA